MIGFWPDEQERSILTSTQLATGVSILPADGIEARLAPSILDQTTIEKNCLIVPMSILLLGGTVQADFDRFNGAIALENFEEARLRSVVPHD
jgi:hypothetical protein